MQLPLEDRYLMTRQDLLSQLAVLLGGRSAEEIAFGEISTGAQNDLQRATDIARAMVTEFGMSDALGAVNYNGHQRNAFLETPFMQPSAATTPRRRRMKIDTEVKRILDRGARTRPAGSCASAATCSTAVGAAAREGSDRSRRVQGAVGSVPPKDPDAVPAEIPPPGPLET